MADQMDKHVFGEGRGKIACDDSKEAAPVFQDQTEGKYHPPQLKLHRQPPPLWGELALTASASLWSSPHDGKSITAEFSQTPISPSQENGRVLKCCILFPLSTSSWHGDCASSRSVEIAGLQSSSQHLWWCTHCRTTSNIESVLKLSKPLHYLQSSQTVLFYFMIFTISWSETWALHTHLWSKVIFALHWWPLRVTVCTLM